MNQYRNPKTTNLKNWITWLSRGLTVLVVAVFMSACSWMPFGDGDASESKSTAETVATLYEEAREKLDDKQFKSAIDLYTEVLALNPYGPYGEQANIDRAYAYYRDQDYDIAEIECERIIRLYPNNARIDYVYYLLALTKYREQEGWWATLRGNDDLSRGNPKLIIDAHDAFAEVVERFPNSAYAVDASERMAYLESALASQELSVAQYYYDQDAWVAAVNRAKGIIESFDDPKVIEPALQLLLKCYLKMGLTDLAEDTRKVIAENYPDNS